MRGFAGFAGFCGTPWSDGEGNRRFKESIMNVIGAYDKEVEEAHLKEYPLPEDHYRVYTDHTGRWFEDFTPEEYKKAFGEPPTL